MLTGTSFILLSYFNHDRKYPNFGIVVDDSCKRQLWSVALHGIVIYTTLASRAFHKLNQRLISGKTMRVTALEPTALLVERVWNISR